MNDNADTVTVNLTRPIQAHGETVTELRLRPPVMGDLRGITLGQITGEFLVTMTARLAGIPPSSAEQIHFSDVPAVAAAISSFFGDAPATGSGA